MQVHELTDNPVTRGDSGGGDKGPADIKRAEVRVEYRKLEANTVLPTDLLAAVRFGPVPSPANGGPLTIDVQLTPLRGAPILELWSASGPVRSGRSGTVRYAHDDHFLFAVIELDEREQGGILAASEAAYTAIGQFQQHSAFPHLLRMWNYLDAINEGTGDLERYRQFCVGRGRGLADEGADRFPAATAIGRQHGTHQLQIFWLAGRTAGRAVENPRQVSAYRYPRAHGPVSPSFSRATVTADGTLFISGTASIVGHVSQHHGDPLEQLEETLRNLTALTSHARGTHDDAFQASLLKVYVRNPSDAKAIEARLMEVMPISEALFLTADICRNELLIEIEAIGKSRGK